MKLILAIISNDDSTALIRGLNKYNALLKSLRSILHKEKSWFQIQLVMIWAHFQPIP